MGEWRDISLGEAIELKRGYDLPRQSRIPGSVPLISSSGLTDFHAIPMVKGPGVVTGRYGTLGKVFYIKEDFWPLNTTLYVRDFKGNNPRFISYFLQSLDFSAYSDKAAVPGLNRNHLHEARVRLPLEVSEQEEIAATLGALDDKIDLNRRMNETLESIARAIFKDWFVDFGPTRAKLAGHAPYLSSDLLSRFPAKLSEDGWPAGWTMKPLVELTTKIGSGATPTGGNQVYVASGTALIRSQNVYDHEFAWNGLARITDGDAQKLRGVTVAEGDILINITGDSILRCCVVDPAALPARVNQHVAIIRTKPNISNRFVHQFLVMPRTKEILIGFDAGGSRAAVTKAHLEALPVLFPGEQILAAFQAITTPLFDRVAACSVENRVLADLRELLLPKLLSGQIRVKGAAKVIGEAT
jgi:type I restriction enzyme S subunit